MKNNPIGIFDSGVGGLTVWKEIVALLPHENLIYLADSKNCPYGSKSHEDIITLSIANTNFLRTQQCKLIIVACNTATAAAIDTLRNQFDIPFIGMEPAIKPAALNSHTGKIGVLATKGTFEGRLFKETSKKYAGHVDQIIQIGEGLVEMVESGTWETESSMSRLKTYIDPMIAAQVDQIVLGCTHYPFFTPLLKKLLPDTIQLIDPAPAIALRTKAILEANHIENKENSPEYKFYSSGKPQILQNILEQITAKNHTIHSMP